MNKMIFGALLAFGANAADALPTEVRSLSLEQISLEQLDLQGQIQTWRLHKVCIDTQAYLILNKGLKEPISITAAFKDGKPEQCRVPQAGK